MTTSSLDNKKSQLQESYIDFTNEQIRALESTTSDAQFDKLMYDYVEDHNYKWYVSEGMSDGQAKSKARMNRKKAGG